MYVCTYIVYSSLLHEITVRTRLLYCIRSMFTYAREYGVYECNMYIRTEFSIHGEI